MNYRSLLATPAFVALLGACGGGGDTGGGNNSSTVPLPASIDATRVQFMQPSSVVTTGCLDNKLLVNASGDVAAFWCEFQTGTPPRLMAGGISASSGSTSTVAVEQDFLLPSPSARQYSVTPLGNRRFAVIHELQPAAQGSSPGTRARVVDLGSAGTPTISASTVLPSNVGSSTPVVRDATGAPYAIASQQAVPFPVINLGGVDSLTIAARTQQPFAQVERDLKVEYRSIDPRALWIVIGQQSMLDQRNLYVTDISLTSGAVSPPIKVSGQPFLVSNGVVNCYLFPSAFSTGVGRWAVSWTQLTSTASGCQLMVNGQRVDADTGSVGRHAVGGADEDLVAVWEQGCADRELRYCRLLWSRFDRTAQIWSAPAPVYAPFDRTDMGHFLQSLATGGGPSIVPGPGGTMAVVWRACQQQGSPGSCQTVATLISKYHNGAWTTRSVSDAVSEFLHVAINGAGQGAAMFAQRSSGSLLSGVAVYQF